MAEELMNWIGDRWRKKITSQEVPQEYRRQHYQSPKGLKKRYPDLVVSLSRDGSRKAANQFIHDLMAEIRTKVAANEPTLPDLMTIRKKRKFTTKEKEFFDKLFWGRMENAKQALSNIHFDEHPTKLQLDVMDAAINAALNEQLPLAPVDTESKLGTWHQRYLTKRKPELKESSYESMRIHLPKFVNHIGKDSDVTSITEETIESFRSSLRSQIDSGAIASVYASNICTSVKTFIIYLYKMKKIPLPLNHDELSFAKPDTEPNPLIIDVAQKIIKESEGLVRCWILCLFNCAYIQSDLSDLKPTEVDWINGRIVRKRSKEQDEKRVPKVNYKLWPSTFKAIKEFGNQSGCNVFLWDGKKLVVRRSDYVGRYFKDYVDKLNIEATVKQIRKTVSTILSERKDFEPWVFTYCGWAPPTIREKYYVPTPQYILDEMSDYLAAKLGITDS